MSTSHNDHASGQSSPLLPQGVTATLPVGHSATLPSSQWTRMLPPPLRTSCMTLEDPRELQEVPQSPIMRGRTHRASPHALRGFSLGGVGAVAQHGDSMQSGRTF